MTTHELKTVNPWFEGVWDGTKPFELRRDDRPEGFAVGDLLVLREWVPHADHPQGGMHTGREVGAAVTHLLTARDGIAGVLEGYVILALAVQWRSTVATGVRW